MALEGTLRDFSLADIFQLIGIQRKTGILTLRSGDETATISFINGLVVAADTDNRKLENRLGHVLVKTHRISQKELEQALEIQKQTLQRLGMVLINKGFIKQEDLKESLKVQTQEIVYRLFRWVDGDYHFHQETYIDYDQENFTPISAESVLMEGIRMLDEWPLIERVIPDYDIMIAKTVKGRSVQLKIEQNFEALKDISFNSLLDDVVSSANTTPDGDSVSDLTHEQEIILQLIDHPMPVQEIIDQSRLIEFETVRALFDLIEQGYAEKLEQSAEETQTVEESERLFIPVWIPFILVSFLAFISFFMQWNPLNPFFDFTGAVYHEAPFADYKTAKKMKQVIDKLDLYFLEQMNLPIKLDYLVNSGYLNADMLVNKDGRALFDYKTKNNKTGYRLKAKWFESGRDPLVYEKNFVKEVIVPEESAPVEEEEDSPIGS
ncbi:MAG: hypothetical protein CR997_12915 [Acidobacteria bacterium]|nr:MAG: hypothetical protein CR997_12915 [Acidobacteriota bacterium]